MVIDTSAIVAILGNESDAEHYENAVVTDPVRMISLATLLECTIVIENRYGDAGGQQLELWIASASVQKVAVENEHLEMARYAFRRYGKGRHRAALNYGDCFSYALAAVSGEPMLFKGEDFTHTDITPAAP